MNVEWIREFTVFARYLNFSRAASMLNMTQPTLSSHIANMEKELGFPLVLRGKTTLLTSAGKRFYTEAERILADLDGAIESCRKLAGDFQGTLRFLKPIRPGGFDRESSQVIRGFCARFPGIVVIELPDSQHTISESLSEGTVDIALVFNRELAGLDMGLRDKVGYLPLQDYHPKTYWLWMDAKNPLAAKDRIELGDLDRCRFLIPSSARYQLLENWADAVSKRYGISLACVHWPGTYEECAEQIAKGEVIILTTEEKESRAIARREDRVCRPIDEKAMELDPCFVYLLENQNPALDKFIEFAEEPLQEKELSGKPIHPVG